MPPDVTWLGPLAGCGAWLGIEMEPPLFWVVAPPLVPLPAELPPLVPLPAELPPLVPLRAELLLLVPVLGDVVASAG